MASRLPIVTTYVINLGIPPLLFVQVLYGRAIYTSTILIATHWISVVFAVLAAYLVLYRMTHLAENGKAWWGWGILALGLLGHVGHVYSTASTLMLRPEVWPGMYDATVLGTRLPPPDPTLWPRLGMVFLGGLGFGALGTSLYTSKQNLDEGVKVFIRRWCGFLALISLPCLAYCGYLAYGAQPSFVIQGLQGEWGRILLMLWPALVGLSLFSAVLLILMPKGWHWEKILMISIPPFLSLASFVVLRDFVRDLSLLQCGFDVWTSPVYTNWLVVGLFLLLFVVGLGFLAWVMMVMRGAKSVEERYVQP